MTDPDSTDPDSQGSRIIQARQYRWQDVPLREYKTADDSFRGVTRQTLLDGDAAQGLPFSTRYFEVEPGGFTSLEHHQHTHTVVILRGTGEVLLERRVEAIAPHDCIFIAPDTLHRFYAGPHEPLGFLCMVASERDRPLQPDETQLRERLAGSVALRRLMP